MEIKNFTPKSQDVIKLFDKFIENKTKFYIHDDKGRHKVYLKYCTGERAFRVIKCDNNQLYSSYSNVHYDSIVGQCFIKCFIFKRLYSINDEWCFQYEEKRSLSDNKFFEPELIGDKINKLLKI